MGELYSKFNESEFMCNYENPVIKYWMKGIRQNLNQLTDNLIQLKLANGIQEQSELLEIELENISKFIEILKSKENLK